MTDRELNDHLAALVDTTAKAHERLRGVQDALAVIRQTAERIHIPDPENIDPDRLANQDIWRKEASLVSRRTTLLLWQAASLLNETAGEIKPVLEPVSPSSQDNEQPFDQKTMNGAVHNVDENTNTDG
ncbi:MAG: hypothetical protein PPP56_04505 [Longimonas sp.]|uniref:hypothetical protein n=1 Tax=Longimonas sp. TaxID=2039626 RepID=UPI0033601E9E